MTSTKISALTDGAALAATDRLPLARSPFATGDNRYVTGAQIQTFCNAAELLTAGRTYYVRTDGSDSNNGLANTSGGAFLTLQKAVDTVAGLDFNFDPDILVTIQMNAGTYNGYTLLPPLINCPAQNPFLDYTGGVLVVSSGGTVTIGNTTAGAPFGVMTGFGPAVEYKFRDIAFAASQTFHGILSLQDGARVDFWGTTSFTGVSNTYHLSAGTRALINFIDTASVVNNVTLAGNGRAVFFAQGGANIGFTPNTSTISGTPTYSVAACYANLGGIVVWAEHSSRTGTANGPMWRVESGGLIDSFGALTTPPGSTAGLTYGGFVYTSEHYSPTSYRPTSGTGANITVVQSGSTTVTNLLAAATAGAGARCHVTDATVTTFASVVAGGGANAVPVYSDGTNWRIG